jgi:hypothetical protein
MTWELLGFRRCFGFPAQQKYLSRKISNRATQKRPRSDSALFSSNGFCGQADRRGERPAVVN